MKGIPVMLMRGGTSKGPLFLAKDLPSDISERNATLLKIMGSPDARQIDGIGGAHPLTSKVAIISPSQKNDCDVDYLFLQIMPDSNIVSDNQNCGNMLAAVGPFAIERGLVKAEEGETSVNVYMQNSGSRAELIVQTPDGVVTYVGEEHIDGVPNTHAAILQNYFGTAGAQCGALLPTGNAIDTIDGIECTLIDNGMPSVVIRANDLGISGYEEPSVLEDNESLKQSIESIRLQAGQLMNLGDVSEKTVPKMCLISASSTSGIINTRSFIPHRVHQAIGVLASASCATACMLSDSVASGLAVYEKSNPCRVQVEHPSGMLSIEIEWEDNDSLSSPNVIRTGLIRTASKLMDGLVFR